MLSNIIIHICLEFLSASFALLELLLMVQICTYALHSETPICSTAFGHSFKSNKEVQKNKERSVNGKKSRTCWEEAWFRETTCQSKVKHATEHKLEFHQLLTMTVQAWDI